jgi:hypothetical protein
VNSIHCHHFTDENWGEWDSGIGVEKVWAGEGAMLEGLESRVVGRRRGVVYRRR